MWIRNEIGHYINMDNVFSVQLVTLKSGDVAIRLERFHEDTYSTAAILGTMEDARNYLDKIMPIISGNKVFKVDMADWNYTGHKKDRKEKRKGGS